MSAVINPRTLGSGSRQDSSLVIDLSQLDHICRGAKWVCLDAETTGTDTWKDSLLGFGVLTDKGGGYLPLIQEYPEQETPEMLAAGTILAPLLRDKPVIGWNLPFDSHLAARLTGTYPAHPVDAQVALWLVNESASMALKSTLSDITGQDWPDFKDILRQSHEMVKERIRAQREEWVQAQKTLGGKITEARSVVSDLFPFPKKPDNRLIPLEMLATYCLRDCVATATAWFAYIRPALEAEGMLDYFYAYEMPFARVLTRIEARGLMIDIPRMQSASATLFAQIQDMQGQLAAISGRDDFNPNSGPQLGWLFYEHLGWDKSGRVSKTTSADSFDEASLKILHAAHASESPAAGLVLDLKRLTKQHGTYTSTMPGKTVQSILHPSINQTGTATGRISIDDGLQNMPKELRVGIRAREGMTLVACDYNQAELRRLADRTADSNLIGVYREGRDLHEETRSRLGITGDKARTIAKAINFGIPYGIGKNLMSENLLFDSDIILSPTDCDRFIKRWYAAYPRVMPWKEAVYAAARGDGYVRTILGRYRHLYELQDPNLEWGLKSYAERQAANALIQGDVGDVQRIAMIRAQPMLEQGFGGHLLLQIHDELLAEVPTEVAPEAARALRHTMEAAFPDLTVPLLAEAKIGQSWGEMKEVG